MGIGLAGLVAHTCPERQPRQCVDLPSARTAHGLFDRGLEAVREIQHVLRAVEVDDLSRRQLDVVRFSSGGVRFSTDTVLPPTISAAYASG